MNQIQHFGSMRISGSGLKLLCGYLLFAATFSVLPIALQDAGIFPQIRQGVWLVLILAIASFVFKMIFYPMVSGEFNFAKYGNDLCLLSFSGLMSAFAFQQSVPFDAFPGARSLGDLPGGTFIQENNMSILAVLIIVLALYVISSILVWASSKQNGWSAICALLSWVVGTIAAMFFVFALSLRLAA